MFSIRVPAPVWFALIAFTGLLIGPEIGSSAANSGAPAAVVPGTPNIDGPQHDLRYWQGYRDASRHWSAQNPITRPGGA